MKRFLLIILLLFWFVPNVFAASIEQAGFVITPQTKTDDNFGETVTNSAETDNVVWTPGSGRKIVLMGMMFWSDLTVNCFVESGSTKVIPNFATETTSSIVVINTGYPIWRGSTDATLSYTTNSDSIHSILLWGYEE